MNASILKFALVLVALSCQLPEANAASAKAELAFSFEVVDDNLDDGITPYVDFEWRRAGGSVDNGQNQYGSRYGTDFEGSAVFADNGAGFSGSAKWSLDQGQILAEVASNAPHSTYQSATVLFSAEELVTSVSFGGLTLHGGSTLNIKAMGRTSVTGDASASAGYGLYYITDQIASKSIYSGSDANEDDLSTSVHIPEGQTVSFAMWSGAYLSPSSIPEPSSGWLMLIGCAAAFLLRHHNHQGNP